MHSNINENTPEAPPELIELFKIYDDPKETTNVADEYPEVLAKLMGSSSFAANWVKAAPYRAPRAGRGGRGVGAGGPGRRPGVAAPGGPRGGRPGGAGGRPGGPAPARDGDGNIIHLHESLPSG